MATTAWPPPPAAYRSFAPLPKDGSTEEAAAHWPPPPPPPADGDTYTAFGAVHHVSLLLPVLSMCEAPFMARADSTNSERTHPCPR
jgi:hypothetical protein